MSESVRIPYVSAEDYLAGERLSEIRHEYVDGELFAMGGASRTHYQLSMNLSIRLGSHLENGPCRVAASDMKVRSTIGNRFYYPNLVVSCNDASEEEDEYVEALVVEVLSSSTEQTDRREKRIAYKSIESLREYVMVSQSHREVSVNRRDGADWLLEVLGPGERTTLDSIGFILEIDDLYRGIDLVHVPLSLG